MQEVGGNYVRLDPGYDLPFIHVNADDVQAQPVENRSESGSSEVK